MKQNRAVRADGTVKTTLVLPGEVHRALKMEAAQRRLTISDIVIEAVSTRIRYVYHSEGKKS